ncbi:hypothetical protein CY34DRAFT_810520 [Suillus luteus UH-Slu-Lm8-n1]|uniref:Uncharacterized protein n=1 Tax=Suillus luteus UH-Slu-Lm8-n1 TaxID=930992 RepID=A0A0C9ZII4_9AGAM|nr:hypothetical protein CY34DRAFT_810520 [Suillus luteus UH-Slu-Lm8-n1]
MPWPLTTGSNSRQGQHQTSFANLEDTGAATTGSAKLLFLSTHLRILPSSPPSPPICPLLTFVS